MTAWTTCKAAHRRGWYVYKQGKDGHGRNIWRVRVYDAKLQMWRDTSREYFTRKQAEDFYKNE